MLARHAATTALQLSNGYPVIAVTGPRQSGKTTLARETFPDKPYLSLEDPDELMSAQDDPRGFLARFPDGAVLDEVQRAPELLSYLQGIVDSDGRMGLFVVTGSQQLGLLSGITQSLAGRVGLIELLPFALSELDQGGLAPRSLEQLMFAGMYPPIHDRPVTPQQWYAGYVRTYVERDVRQLINVRDLGQFRRFVRMCAARTGQLLNLSGLANDCGITHNTARAWVSVLEASYLVHLLRPHHRNFEKRLIKTPKLCFYDPGLAAWLLGIRSAKELETHAMRGPLFETWVVSEFAKAWLNRALVPPLFFWRDRAGNEVDLVIERGERLIPIEIKSGQTVTGAQLAGLRRFLAIGGDASTSPVLVFGGDTDSSRHEITIRGWRSITALAEQLARAELP